ncbi:MAG: MerC domain-containing protein, partial [Bdellovibrionales bacterium]
MNMNSFWDRLGISASILCGIHCLLTPLIVLLVPALGGIFSHQAFHWVIAVVVFPAAVFALWMGYRIHQYSQMLILGGVGLIFLVIGIWAGSYEQNLLETGTMIVAGLFLTSAHFLNMRACRAARITATPGQPQPPHDHSSSAKAARKEPDSSKS